jgi:hypothetical protein
VCVPHTLPHPPAGQQPCPEATRKGTGGWAKQSTCRRELPRDATLTHQEGERAMPALSGKHRRPRPSHTLTLPNRVTPRVPAPWAHRVLACIPIMHTVTATALSPHSQEYFAAFLQIKGSVGMPRHCWPPDTSSSGHLKGLCVRAPRSNQQHRSSSASEAQHGDEPQAGAYRRPLCAAP